MPCQGSCKNTYWHGGLIHANVTFTHNTYPYQMKLRIQNQFKTQSSYASAEDIGLLIGIT